MLAEIEFIKSGKGVEKETEVGIGELLANRLLIFDGLDLKFNESQERPRL